MGVTGTNGKTSTTLLSGAALAAAAKPVAMVTTLGAFLDRDPFDASPDYTGFVATMRAGRDKGGRFAAIELTSEALALGFAKAWPCRVGVFTNLTRDHLDAHGSAEHYLASKAQLFMQLPAGGVAVLNAADPASELLEEVVPAHAQVVRYGVPTRGEFDAADFAATEVSVSWDGTSVVLENGNRLQVAAIGEVFAENALAALAAAVGAGVDSAAAAAAIAAAPPPAGRFEVVTRSPHVVVDYAHTPDALRRTLVTARALCTGSLTVVFGAGGERDQAKRPLMGEAATVADHIVLTSDNPRSEDPAEIAKQIAEGIDGGDVVTVLDRAQAIRDAVRGAAPGDVVLVAGKGHERTQTIDGQERVFSDAEIVRAARSES